MKLEGLVPGVTVRGEKVTDAPGGRPVALRATGKLKGPDSGANAKSKMTALPEITVWLVVPAGLSGCGVSVMLKSSTSWGNVVEILLIKLESPE